MNNASLKISVSPRDHRFIKHLLPHQLKVWHRQVKEILIVFDLHGYDAKQYQQIITDFKLFINKLSLQFPNIRLITVDYSAKAKKEISDAYFGFRNVPEKTHRYGPYYSYFYGLYHTRYDYVLNLDCDIFFGGDNPNWVKEAMQLLSTDKRVITCSPLPGPPRPDGVLTTQSGTVDRSELKKVIFDSFSTRLFFIDKKSFINAFCPLPIKIAAFPLLVKALLRKKPVYALPEDVLTDIMRSKNLIRVDFLGGGNGMWSLHPPYRNESFYEELPSLIKRIENNDIPDEQRGDYDINDSMINWEDARQQIRQASIKLKFLRLFGLSR